MPFWNLQSCAYVGRESGAEKPESKQHLKQNGERSIMGGKGQNQKCFKLSGQGRFGKVSAEGTKYTKACGTLPNSRTKKRKDTQHAPCTF